MQPRQKARHPPRSSKGAAPAAPTRKRGPQPRSPEEQKQRRLVATRKAALKWWRKKRRAELSELERQRPPQISEAEAIEAGLSVTTKRKRPRLAFIDAHGKVRFEDYRSAEKLITDWKKGWRP
jgi:hypothetical protein